MRRRNKEMRESEEIVFNNLFSIRFNQFVCRFWYCMDKSNPLKLAIFWESFGDKAQYSEQLKWGHEWKSLYWFRGTDNWIDVLIFFLWWMFLRDCVSKLTSSTLDVIFLYDKFSLCAAKIQTERQWPCNRLAEYLAWPQRQSCETMATCWRGASD